VGALWIELKQCFPDKRIIHGDSWIPGG